ncbi:MAG: citrate (Si)-synthase [Myxococcales bacterium]|mgnify:CR=1 FL=1|nr:citrate (Si)-synthase [Myxococcales bacterium]|tara:strand:- start:3484 stop:4770 length:1287 start_codon:yes stop_codon:yes gene_type:complete
MTKESVTITDNRTGRTYELPVEDGTIRAMDLRAIKVSEEDFGLMAYDPGYKNTAACRSNITFINGGEGILRYRGYGIEDLAERCTFLEVAYLIIKGELPTADQLADWTDEITHHTFLHENIRRFMEGFRIDAHPMGMFVATVGALSTFYPDAKRIQSPDSRELSMIRLIAKVPTIAAFSYRHGMGLPFVYPLNTLSYPANFLSMVKKIGVETYEPHPDLVRAMDVLFILHADHEQNCSATAMRGVGSSHADPFSATAAAAAALYGPLHGGANEAVLRMLREIGTIDRIPAYIESVKKGEHRLMGFGHRVYKAYDPRARIIKKLAYDVFDVTGKNPLIELAIELESIALSDDYFVSRNLYPNVDFYSGLIYEAMQFPPAFFTVLFGIPRTVGWLAQWEELLKDSEQKIARPRQIYTGIESREFVEMSQR